ncbi:MAG: hypothetical protein ACOX6P_01690 [Candidatus Merdivicinus sp.]|jgi:hypothetical protein
MRLYPHRKAGWRQFLGIGCGIGLMLVLGIFLVAMQNAAGQISAEQIRMTEDAIRRAAISCYAIEGSYPQNLEDLMERYGVQIDEKKYVVEYNLMGSNTMPYIEVVPRGGRSKLDTNWEKGGGIS